jgi:hypothetical protein
MLSEVGPAKRRRHAVADTFHIPGERPPLAEFYPGKISKKSHRLTTLIPSAKAAMRIPFAN